MNKLPANLLKYIRKSIKLNNMKSIVLIESYPISGIDNHTYNANIYCIDENNNIIWQVDTDKGLMEKDSFISIQQAEDGIIAQRFFGIVYLIDPVTGKSKEVGWNK